MQGARMLGNYISYLANEKGLSISDLSNALGCSNDQVYLLLKGRAYASFSQISNLAALLETPIAKLLSGNEEIYSSTVVHCMNDFQDPKNREDILDLIEDYVDLVDAVDTLQ